MREPARSKHQLIFILITIFIDVLGFGIIIPVFPDLIAELTGAKMSEAAIYGGWLMFSFAAAQFIFAPIIGNLSDAVGRRPVLLISLFTLFIDYLIMGFATTIVWLFVGRVLSGIGGATYLTANAYITDITPEEDRAKNFGYIGAAFGLGFILGPAIGGLLGAIDLRLPFFAAGGFALLNMAYGYFVLPESLAKDNRRPFSLARSNIAGALRQISQYPLVVMLIGSLIFYQLAHDALPATWTFFTKHKFNWGESEVGFSLAVVGVCVMIVQAVLLQMIIKRFGEVRAIFFGLVIGAAGFVGYALASSDMIFMAFILPQTFFAIANPALRSIMTREVPADAQGELQGALTSLISLTAVVSPILMTQTFSYFSSGEAPVEFPGAPFLLAAILLIICLTVALLALKRHGYRPPAEARD